MVKAEIKGSTDYVIRKNALPGSLDAQMQNYDPILFIFLNATSQFHHIRTPICPSQSLNKSIKANR